MASKDWGKFRWGREAGIKTELLTSLVFFSSCESKQTSKVSGMDPFIPDIAGAACGMEEAGQCAWRKGRRTETRDNVEGGQGRPGLGGWDLCELIPNRCSIQCNGARARSTVFPEYVIMSWRDVIRYDLQRSKNREKKDVSA